MRRCQQRRPRSWAGVRRIDWHDQGDEGAGTIAGMEPADRCDWCERTVPVDEFKYGPTILMERPDLGIYSQEGVRLCSVCQFALQMGPKWDTFLAEHGAAPEFFHWLAGKMSLAHPDVVARTLARRGDGNANVF